jgi:hypothetical protein
MVEVVSRADDLAIADPHHEDARHRERLAGAISRSLILELGHDHLRIGRLVNGDVGRPAAFLGFFRCLVADAPAKIGIAEALLDVGGDGGEAAQASAELHRAFGALLQRAKQAGVIRDDLELPEVYALLVGVSQAAARQHLDEQATGRMLTIVFDGLTPRRPSP